MSDRRRFIATSVLGTLGVLAAPRVGKAQQGRRAHRIGWLTPAVVARGYVDGQTIALESRSAEDDLRWPSWPDGSPPSWTGS